MNTTNLNTLSQLRRDVQALQEHLRECSAGYRPTLLRALKQTTAARDVEEARYFKQEAKEHVSRVF